MGAFWLHQVDDAFRAAGIPFREYSGWLTRSRSSGGFDDIRGAVLHNTVSNTTWQNDCAYMWLNATSKPIGNFHLDRSGVWTLGCAGASNTNGRGIANWSTSHGVIPIEPSTMGNRMALAIEAANGGTGQRWPQVQVESYFEGLAVLSDLYDFKPNTDITTHRGWAGTRKQDPYGPADGYPGLGSVSWVIPEVRRLVAAEMNEPPPPPPDPDPDPPPPTPAPTVKARSVYIGDNDMVYISKEVGKPTLWYSVNAGGSRIGCRNPEHAAQVEQAYAGRLVNAQTRVKVAGFAQATAIPTAELTARLGPVEV